MFRPPSTPKPDTKPAATLSPSNERLIQACLRGDQGAWQQLVDRYSRLVHSVPVRYDLPPQAVDDVAQDVFLALARHLHQVEDPDALPAWLITTARRLSWRAVQKQRRETAPDSAELSDAPQGLGDPVLSAPLPTLADLLRGWGHQEILSAGLTRLEQRCRDLLSLIFLDPDEPTYDEIADRLKMPKGSIGPTRNRCLAKLREILTGLGFGAEDI